MKEYLKSFLDEFDYPVEAKSTFLFAYDKLCEYDKVAFDEIIERYNQNIEIDFSAMITDISTLADKCGVHEYTAYLLLFILLSKRLKKYMLDNGYGAEMWRESVVDLKYKLIECKLVKGVWGTFCVNWFVGFYKLEKFKLGRLQFRTITFDINCVVDGQEITPETVMIDVHIPRTGTKLDHDEVEKSYEMAAKLFKERFGVDKAIFFCASWLLYPKNLQLLNPESNMYKFINDFNIVKSVDYDDYHELWRLFDMDFFGDTSVLPADSSLRRGYIDWVNKGEKTGYGVGIFVYKKDKSL